MDEEWFTIRQSIEKKLLKTLGPRVGVKTVNNHTAKANDIYSRLWEATDEHEINRLISDYCKCVKLAEKSKTVFST